MSSFFHRALRRTLSSSVHVRPLRCSRKPLSLNPTVQQWLRPPSHLRFSISTTPKARGRPYPHRPYQDYHKPPFLGFLDRIPQNTVFWGIIIVNGVVFVAWTLTKQRALSENIKGPYYLMLKNFRSSWQNFSEGRVWTPITATFSHEAVYHILFNGCTFYFMAKPVLELLGTRKFLFLYMGGGLVSALVSMGWQNLIKHQDIPTMGASGAIYSIISLLACIAPKATFQLYGIIPVPAWLAVSGIFAYDTYSAIYGKRPETDTAGHVGGLLSGVAYYLAIRFRIF